MFNLDNNENDDEAENAATIKAEQVYFCDFDTNVCGDISFHNNTGGDGVLFEIAYLGNVNEIQPYTITDVTTISMLYFVYI